MAQSVKNFQTKEGSKMLHKTKVATLVTVGLLFAAGCSNSDAAPDEYPSQDVQLIIPFPAGGGTDQLSRPFADQISGSDEFNGAQMEVVNKAGAAATLGVNEVLNADPDGYTLGVGAASTFGVTPSIMDVPWGDDQTPYEGISMLATYEIGFWVAADSEHADAQSVLDAVKDSPGTIKVGTAGAGTDSHLALLALQAEGYDFEAVPFEGNAPALTALLGNNVDAISAQLGPILPQMEAGEVRALATSGSEPNPSLEGVPTWTDVGVDAVVEGGFFIYGPQGMDEEIVNTVAEAVAVAAESEQLDTLVSQGGFRLNTEGPARIDELVDRLGQQANDLG